MPLEDLLLAVQRHVIAVLGHDHLREQSGAGVRFRQRRGLRRRRTDGALAILLAGVLQSRMLDDDELGRCIVQRLANLLADARQHVELGLLRFREIVLHAFPRQVLRQRRATRPLPLIGDLLGQRRGKRQGDGFAKQLGLAG